MLRSTYCDVRKLFDKMSPRLRVTDDYRIVIIYMLKAHMLLRAPLLMMKIRIWILTWKYKNMV